MDWQNIMIFGILPIITVLSVFFIKKKLLWVSPIISTALHFTAYMLILGLQGMQSPIIKIFRNSEWRAFLLLFLFIQFAITVVLTMIIYLIAHILKHKRK